VPHRAAIYVRISEDRSGLQAGVKRQEQDCLALADRKGWPVAAVYCDNDVSAWSGGQRPQYERLLEDITSGAVDAVITWDLDRLHRHPRELERFFDACDRAGLAHLASVSGDVDLGTADGRLVARIMGAVARKESDDKSRRIKRKMLELAEQGAPRGGGRRPFGYEADGLTVRTGEAALVREASERVLTGEGLHGICADWQNRGITTPTGKPWGTRTLKRVLLSGRVAGLREHQGAVIGPAQWEAIIDDDNHKRLHVVLNDPGRWTNGGVLARKYLLTGFAYCALCDHRLVARPRENKVRSMSCVKIRGGCGKLRIVAEPLEDYVRDAVLEALDSPALWDALAATEEGEAQADLLNSLRADEEMLERLAQDHYVEAAISRQEYMAARTGLERRMDTTRKALERHGRTGVLSGLSRGAEALRVMWDERDLTWRRALVSAVIEKVILKPAVKGRNFFDPERVEVVWRA
jgi:site-specific DNA recombinase